jgi:hypothetical protein
LKQHLVTRYGDYFIQAIQKLSKELNLSLDGEVSVQPIEVRKVSPIVTNKSTKLQGAKFEAWKMWHEEGLSIQKIAVCLTILLLLLKIYASHVLMYNFFLSPRLFVFSELSR